MARGRSRVTSHPLVLFWLIRTLIPLVGYSTIGPVVTLNRPGFPGDSVDRGIPGESSDTAGASDVLFCPLGVMGRDLPQIAWESRRSSTHAKLAAELENRLPDGVLVFSGPLEPSEPTATSVPTMSDTITCGCRAILVRVAERAMRRRDIDARMFRRGCHPSSVRDGYLLRLLLVRRGCHSEAGWWLQSLPAVREGPGSKAPATREPIHRGVLLMGRVLWCRAYRASREQYCEASR